MQEVGLTQLLEAGVHFGHQTSRWNPKMKQYIFTERNGIHIIDLRKTLDRLVQAQQAVREVVLRGERLLFVCTKKQLRSIVEQEAQRSGSYYVTERWLGGMLTNFQTIRKQIRRLKELERGQEENAFEFYTKKERLMLDRERLKLDKYLVGVKEMGRLPGAIFVVDAKREAIAVREANRLKIPVIAITDTNADGKADRFDTISDAWGFSTYHEYAFGSRPDSPRQCRGARVARRAAGRAGPCPAGDDRPAALGRGRGHLPLPAGGRAALHPGSAAGGRAGRRRHRA
jgi:ribosomal protein S2